MVQFSTYLNCAFCRYFSFIKFYLLVTGQLLTEFIYVIFFFKSSLSAILFFPLLLFVHLLIIPEESFVIGGRGGKNYLLWVLCMLDLSLVKHFQMHIFIIMRYASMEDLESG